MPASALAALAEPYCPRLTLVGNYSMDRLYARLEALLVDSYECHLDLSRCTRVHRLAEAESLVQYLAERVRSLYVSPGKRQGELRRGTGGARALSWADGNATVGRGGHSC